MKKDFLKKIDNHKIWIILVIVFCVRILIYSFYSDFSVYPDTSSYVNFEASILKGEVDAFRTPIYPYIIKLVSTFSNNQQVMYRNITILQEIVSIISVIVLYMTLKKELKNQNINYIVTILYACLPSIFTYNRVILTESLSISLFMIYFCLIIKYIKEPTNQKTILIGLFTVLLIMLRPSFIYLIIALAIMFLLIYICKKGDVKQALLGGIVLTVIVGIVLGYCYLNKKQNDIFAISNVTQINQLDTVIEMQIYSTGDEQDQGIINIIEQKLDGDAQIWYRTTTDKIMEEYTPDQIDGYLKRCIKNNFSTYIRKTIKKVVMIALEPCNQTYLWAESINVIQPRIYFIIIYLYILFEVIYVLVKIIKNNKIPLEQFTMLIIILGQFATIILGAQAEYSRLFVQALPIVIISIALHIEEILELHSIIKNRKAERKLENEI